MKANNVTFTVQETTDRYRILLTAEFDNGISIGSKGTGSIEHKQEITNDTLKDFVNRVIIETERQLKIN